MAQILLENHRAKIVFYLVRVGFILILNAISFTQIYAADTKDQRKQPVLLTAKQVTYDQPSATAIAIGNVELVQGDTIVLADKITYNQNTDVVHAIGHVSILQSTGDVAFANDAVLKQSLGQGVVEEFRARLKDNSLFAAREANKINDKVTKLSHLVYSPCSVCAAKSEAEATSPLWQIQATNATIDENDQRVTYRNAFMDIYGVPVMYTPFFFHPTPDSPSKSGLLQPQYLHSSYLGNVVKEPAFISFAPNTDMTLTPWYLSSETNPMLQGEFRHMFDGGQYSMRGAFINTYKRDNLGDIVPGNENRGYIDAHGKMQLSDNWSSGIDVERTTDDTFLGYYGIGWQSLLTSRIYAERVEDRSYLMVESLAFQGLQPQDTSAQSPYVLPQAELHFESEPLAQHSRLAFDSNMLALERDQGASDRRLSDTVAWKLPYVTSGGQVFEAKASVRGDAYSVTDQTISTTGQTFNGTTGRVMPELDLDWRYPFINSFGESKSITIAPIVEVAMSPNLHQSSNIPNEDSQVAELNDINLFSPNRFSGYDQIESGVRGTYGMRGNLQYADDKYLEWLLGQAYQQNAQSPFPLATDATTNLSDYIGHVEMKYKWIDLGYSARVDKDSLAFTSNEVKASFSLTPFSINANYVDLKNEPLFGNKQEVYGDTKLNLNKNWDWIVSGRKDLGSSVTTATNTSSTIPSLNILTPSAGTVGLGTGFLFHNECLNFSLNAGKSYISQQDLKPATTYSFTLILKNFGNQDNGNKTDDKLPETASSIQ